MAFITADRVKETTVVTGTGPITLLGAVSGYRPFSSVMLSIGDTCPYAIVNANASQWEVGIATYTDVNTLTRTTIHASTADPDTDPVDFAAGIKDVFLAPTARTVLSDITSNDGTVTLSKVGSIVDLSVAIAAATENVVVQVRNNTGATLTKGTVVYINNAIGQLPTVAKALATSDATSAQTLGMISADLGNNENGYVTIIGLIDDINTGTYQDGDQLYLSGTTAGAFTKVKPYAPMHLVYVGIVEHAHNVHGKIFVKVQNGYELDELHNVSAQNPSNGQTIVYNTASHLWEKNTVSLTVGVNGTLPVSKGGTGLTALGTANQVVTVNAGGTGLTYSTPQLSTLSDVAVAGLTNGDLLRYDGIAGAWSNTTAVMAANGDSWFTLLRRMNKLMESLTIVDSQQRQRVAVEVIPTTTVTGTVSVQSTTGSYTSQLQAVGSGSTTTTATTFVVNEGPVDQRWRIVDDARSCYGINIRSRLTFS